MFCNVGKLYHCPELFITVYPTLEKADEGESGNVSSKDRRIQDVEAQMSWLSNRFKCKIFSTNPRDVFIVLEQKIIIKKSLLGRVNKKYIKILGPGYVGWIINEDWYYIREIKNYDDRYW